jgi:cell division protein FtsQ
VSGKLRVSLEARKNRLRRRLLGGLGESLSAVGLLFAATFFSTLFIYACCALLSADYLEIKEVSVRGVKELTEQDILALANITPHANILSLNTDAVEKRISANPWVKQIHVGRELPDRLVLDVRERKPIALVKQSGAFYLMDAGGFAFKKLSKGDDVDLAIVTVVNIQDQLQSGLLADALKLLETLSGADHHVYLGTVSEVHVDELFGVSILTDKGLHLKLGRDNFAGKLQQLNVVLADLEKRGMKNGHLFVDLADIAKVTVQRKDALGKAREKKEGPQYRL